MSKQEKKGLVPALRFPEFKNSGEWEHKPFEEAFKRLTTKNVENNQNALTISAQQGLVSQLEYFNKKVAAKDLSGYYLLHKGDFAYNKSYSQGYPMGAIKPLKLYDKGVVSTLYICFRAKKGFKESFFEHYFETGLLNPEIGKIAQEGGRAHGLLNVSVKEFFKDVNLVVPQPGEQQKIADCLTSVDELITAQTQKLDTLKTHKKGLMQQLFPAEGETVPKLRFPEFRDKGEWELKPIGDKVDLLSGFPFKSAEISEDPSGIPLMRGINITEGYIRHSQDIDRFYLGETKDLEKYKLQTNDLVIGMDGSKVGKNSALITALDAGSLLIQRVARLRTDCTSTILFIFQHIHSSRFHSYVDRINTSGGIPHISAKQINDFEICFPTDKEEQQKVADCLACVDDLISVHSKKLDVLKIHKKGLLQQLYPATDDDCTNANAEVSA